MRDEKEIYELILNIANSDDRIRAVYMNGSRTNVNVPKDIFQDYDIVYVVKETQSFIKDKNWINKFGEILYMQYPDENSLLLGEEANFDKNYGYLMQLTDGNRIDLHIQEIEFAKKEILKDKLCKILLDKDAILPNIPKATDEDYFIKKPSEHEFLYTCNDFWWCLNNVGKGLWREEIPYVQDMINFNIRPLLINALSWKIGIDKNYSVSIGKSGKYMYRYLPEKLWKNFLETYSSYKSEEVYKSVVIMCNLFNEVCIEVSEKLNYYYNVDEAENSYEYFKYVSNLPKDITEIY